MDAKIRLTTEDATMISQLMKKHDELRDFIPRLRGCQDALRIQVPPEPSDPKAPRMARITLSPRADHASPNEVHVEAEVSHELLLTVARVLEREMTGIRDELERRGVEPE